MAELITNIVLHCTDSLWGCAREIRQWHLQRGFKDIAYHFVVLNGRPTPNHYIQPLDGSIECGRYLDESFYLDGNEVGAHALGYNKNSLGVVMVGINEFTSMQMTRTRLLLRTLCTSFGVPAAKVIGHNETEDGIRQGKTCPNVDMDELRAWLTSEEQSFWPYRFGRKM